LGVLVNDRIPIETRIHRDNLGYLQTKAERMHHLLKMPEQK
jgi:GTP cyclohydrolase II